VKRFLKIGVALALVAALVYGVDWNEARGLIGRVTVITFIVVAAAMLVELALSAVKWSWALRMHGLVFDFAHLFRAICTGYFLNNFLPSAIGGDAYRVYRTLPPDGYRSRALSAVIVERGTGFGALLALGALGALALTETAAARAYLIAVSVGGVAGLAILFALSRGALTWLKSRLSRLKLVDAIEHNIGMLTKARGEWIYVIALSFAFQATSILILYWLFMQLGFSVSLQQCALMAAASGIAAVLPLSINGVGLMEGSLVGMAIALGVDYDSALLVAVVRRLMMAVTSALCGVAYVLEPKVPRTASA
jgi:glycosyltransferase 2 family protein